MHRSLALLLVVAAGSGWSTEKGRRFDVHAPTSGKAAKVSRWAEETARSFVDLLEIFPGRRAAVVVPYGFEVPGVVLRGGMSVDPPPAGPDESWRFTVPPEPSGEVQGSLVPRAPDEETRFRHHLGHRLLAEWTKRLPDGGPKPDGSGCPLPDWFEEAVAVDMEPEFRKKDYRKAFAEAVRKDEVHGLGVLLGLRRPAGARKSSFDSLPPGGVDVPDLPEPKWPPGLSEEEKERIRRILEEWRKARERLDRLRLQEGAVDHAEGVIFEVQSWALLEFLRQEYGVAFVREVADTLGRNRGLSNCYPWLAAHRAELRHPSRKPPGTDRELEAAWKAWALGK